MNTQLDLVLSVPPSICPAGVQVRTAGTQDAPLFCLADVCRAIALGNAAQVAARLDDDEKGIILSDTPSGQQQMVFVTEPGLYKVVMRSDKPKAKPKAKPFSRWVCHEVLPCIRRHGCYPAPAQGQSRPDELSRLVTAFQQSMASVGQVLVALGEAQKATDARMARLEQILAGLAQPQAGQQFYRVGPAISLREQVRRLWPKASERDLARCVSLIKGHCQLKQVEIWKPVQNGPWVIQESDVHVVNQVVMQMREQAESPLFSFDRQTSLN